MIGVQFADWRAVVHVGALVVVVLMAGLVGLTTTSSASAPAPVAQQDAPVADCSVSETTVAPGESVTLDASASEGATAYRYDTVGDGSFGEWLDRASLDVSYDDPGTYEPHVEVMSHDESTDIASCGTVTVESDNEPPSAVFTYSPPVPTTSEPATFESNSTDPDGEIVSHEWRVDGEVVGEGPTVEYTFPDPGEYVLELTVTDDDGATDTDSVTVTVEADNEPPTADVSFSPSEPVPEEAVTFEADAGDPDGEVAGYEWTVDDELAGEGPTLEYAFPEPGDYTVAIIVTDDDGATATAERTVTVESTDETATPSGDVSVTAAWWYNPLDPSAGETVTLVHDGPDDPRVTYRWDIDDDGQFESEGSSVSVAFPEPGERRVTLQAVGPEGATTSRSETIRVHQRRTQDGAETGLSFWITPIDPKPGQTVTLVAEPTGSPAQVERYRWDIDGDGEFDAEGRSVTYAYPGPGDYTVTLETEDESGRVNRSTGGFSQSERPPGYDRVDERRPSLWMTPLDPAPGQTVTLVADPAVSPDEVERYRWDVDGDGETDAEGRSVTYAFPEDGQFPVTLTIERTDGSEATVGDSVAVGNATTDPGQTTDPEQTVDNVTTTEVTTTTDDGETTTEDGPGLGVAAALVALLAVALLLARRGER